MLKIMYSIVLEIILHENKIKIILLWTDVNLTGSFYGFFESFKLVLGALKFWGGLSYFLTLPSTSNSRPLDARDAAAFKTNNTMDAVI